MIRINRKSIKFKILSIATLLLLSIFIAKMFMDNWRQIPFESLKFNYRILLLAILLSVVNPLISVALWRYILNLLGEHPSLIQLWRINSYATMAKYIPGKIWQYVGKIYFGAKIGLSEKKILISTLLDTIFIATGAFFVSIYSLKYFVSIHYISEYFAFGAYIIFAGIIIILHPAILQKLITVFFRRWLSSSVVLRFSYVHVFILIFFYSLQWLVIGLQFYLFICSFYEIPFHTFFYFVSLNTFSWLVGFLSVITPGGLLVKEGIFALGFKTVVPISFAILCAVLLRLFSIVTEFLIASLFFIFDKGAWQNFLSLRSTVTKEKKE